jgi:hypothetical protein
MACTNKHFKAVVKGISKTPVHRLKGKRVIGKIKHECTMLYNEDDVVLMLDGDADADGEFVPKERFVKVTAKNNTAFELRFKYDSRRDGVEYVKVYGLKYAAFQRNLPTRFGPTAKKPLVMPIYALMQTPQELFKRFPEPSRRYMNKMICNMKPRIEYGQVARN